MSEIELDEMDRARYEEIFKKLDRDGNGKIDIHDLKDALGFSEKFAKVSVNHKILFLFICVAYRVNHAYRC